MKKSAMLLLMVCFVFAGYAGDDSSASDGAVQAQKLSEQFLKTVQSIVVDLQKCRSQVEVDTVVSRFKDAQSKLMNALFALYNKYPSLRNEGAVPGLKKISDQIDALIKKYKTLRTQMVKQFKDGTRGGDLVIKSGLSRSQIVALVVTSFNKVAVDLDSAQTGKQAAQIIVAFVGNMRKLKDLYPNLKGGESPGLKKAAKKFMKALMAVAMKYSQDKDFMDAVKSMRTIGK